MVMLCRALRQSFVSSLRRFSVETGSPAEYQLTEVGEVGDFIRRCLVAVGAAETHAASLAATLVHADVRGHFSHGLNRLGEYLYEHAMKNINTIFFSIEMYCNEVESEQCDGRATPYVVKETIATALVDGQNGMGPVSWYTPTRILSSIILF